MQTARGLLAEDWAGCLAIWSPGCVTVAMHQSLSYSETHTVVIPISQGCWIIT